MNLRIDAAKMLVSVASVSALPLPSPISRPIVFHSDEIVLQSGESRIVGRTVPFAYGESGVVPKVLSHIGMALLPPRLVPWALPKRPLAIQSLEVHLVDAKDRVVSPSTAFLHHFVIKDGKGAGPMSCPFNTRWVFGGGAESGGPVLSLPEGYAYYTVGDEVWTAEYHIIDLRGVPFSSLHACFQCACAGGLGGSVQCCMDGHRCPQSVIGFTDWPPATYRIRFTILAMQADEARAAMVRSVMLTNHAISGQSRRGSFAPGNNMAMHLLPSYNAAQSTADECLFEYDIAKACDGKDECQFTSTASWDAWPETLEVVAFSTHVHPGAKHLNILLDGEEVCRLNMSYADASALTSPLGYPFINATTRCVFTPPIHFVKGSHVVMSSTYDTHMPRLGVMSLIFMAAVEIPRLKHATPVDKQGLALPLSVEAISWLPTHYTPSVRSWAIDCCATTLPWCTSCRDARLKSFFPLIQQDVTELCMSPSILCMPNSTAARDNAWPTSLGWGGAGYVMDEQDVRTEPKVPLLGLLENLTLLVATPEGQRSSNRFSTWVRASQPWTAITK
mmetsp:Transcript_34021/g.56343  ORF Transcript_34021/g.56343 Transcript_34021/m.56343 type:complete len:561 (-) Transcript_34021:128-1810(-)|eukprot:CAMPEP_0119341552 /NCGR_PEP_ID=MMETSP1333-20130426/102678_1 /TAXON_ID=418940 /ORGANISM="Scyphosphaera apsteinii, Strain RCC1455" /LENGTH=560 /DNA_ID=CAMNT_0007353547 /DNA_START=13 /DNA_END=1695 /DNA_ORIENTATION=+